MYGFVRIVVWEFISCDLLGNIVKFDDILMMDKFGGACKFCDLVRELEYFELKFLFVYVFLMWVGMRLNVIFEEYGWLGVMIECFSVEVYWKVCNSL